jgi:streptogramin lyase
MFGFHFASRLLRANARRKAKPIVKAARPRLVLETLEDRCLPSTTNVFALPTASNIAAERIQTLDGNLFFTTSPGEIGRITPTGQITPNFAPGGNDLAVGADGNLYTAFANTIERITPNGAVTDFAVPTPNAFAESITAGPDGNIWFEETSVDQVGRLNPATGVITEFALSQLALYEAPAFGGITAGPDGNVWVTEPIFNQIARITPDGAVTEFSLPANALSAEQITAGPDGNVYFTQPGLPNSTTPVAPQIGRITPNGQVTEFTLPVTGGQLSFDSGIMTGPDGNIYFDSSTGLGRITTTGQVTENLSPPPPFGVGLGITVGPDGNIWLANYGQIEQVLIGGTTAAAPTTTALSTSVSSAVFGQTETLTATVGSATGTPAGTVTFFDGSTALGSATLNASGQATLTISLGVGVHSLTASFAATSAFAASTSAAVSETVTQAVTTTVLSASTNSLVTGQSVVFTATVAAVAPGAGTPTGTVTFTDGKVILGTVTLGAGGQATFTTSFSVTGSHTITAVYNGDTNFVAGKFSSAQTVTEQVTAPAALAPTTIALAASANAVRVGQTVTFTATVSGAPGTGTPTGTITFMVGNVVVARVTLDATGKAHLTGFFSVAGKYTIRAVYSGDSHFAASTQSITEQVS